MPFMEGRKLVRREEEAMVTGIRRQKVEEANEGEEMGIGEEVPLEMKLQLKQFFNFLLFPDKCSTFLYEMCVTTVDNHQLRGTN
jgi:hypothetical protein